MELWIIQYFFLPMGVLYRQLFGYQVQWCHYQNLLSRMPEKRVKVNGAPALKRLFSPPMSLYSRRSFEEKETHSA